MSRTAGPSVRANCSMPTTVGAAYFVVRPPLAAHAGKNGRSEPVGTVAIVCTDVQGAMRLWENDAAVMQRAFAEHHRVLRRTISRFGGYEATTEADSFMVVFSDPVAAIRMCIAAQSELRAGNWPTELSSQPDAATVYAPGGRRISRGLRVRVGVHVGEPRAIRNPTTARLEYLGPTVNRASCIAQLGHGGEILVSQDLWLATNGRSSAEPRRIGQVRLRGTGTLTDLIQVSAAGGPRPSFPPPRAEHLVHEALAICELAAPG